MIMQSSAGHGRQFLHNFDLDIYPGLRFIPGRVYELIDYKQYLWPGHGLPADAETYQFVEAEYMMADEYDALIKDPSDFMTRVIMPRFFGAFEPFQKLKPPTSIVELETEYFMPYTVPDVRVTLQVHLVK
jgi:hypothetical protein